MISRRDDRARSLTATRPRRVRLDAPARASWTYLEASDVVTVGRERHLEACDVVTVRQDAPYDRSGKCRCA